MAMHDFFLTLSPEQTESSHLKIIDPKDPSCFPVRQILPVPDILPPGVGKDGTFTIRPGERIMFPSLFHNQSYRITEFYEGATSLLGKAVKTEKRN